MQLVGLLYALFAAGTVAVSWAVPARLRGGVLAAASLLFYVRASPGLGAPALILGLSLLVWLVGEALAGRAPERRPLLVATTALCVGVLAYFKYGRFVLDSLAAVAPGPWRGRADGWLAATVPLGISFFTFELVHYLVDTYRHRTDRRQARGDRLADFLAFAWFFPTLLAGPIKRYQQFTAAERPTESDLAYGLGRILLGVAKKVLVADTVAELAGRLALPDQVTPHGLWVAMYAYAVQIYFDFSGYSDLAIGLGRLFGYRIPENFAWPYGATSLPEFWRRWHISLSTWIRDYLFIPLGGSRVSLLRNMVNLLAVMAVCGLWHGPAWHFVAWGVWHGVGLAATRLWRAVRPVAAAGGPGLRLVAWLATFHFVCFGWVLFAAPSLHAAAVAFRRMLHVP